MASWLAPFIFTYLQYFIPLEQASRTTTLSHSRVVWRVILSRWPGHGWLLQALPSHSLDDSPHCGAARLQVLGRPGPDLPALSNSSLLLLNELWGAVTFTEALTATVIALAPASLSLLPALMRGANIVKVCAVGLVRASVRTPVRASVQVLKRCLAGSLSGRFSGACAVWTATCPSGYLCLCKTNIPALPRRSCSISPPSFHP